MNKKLFYPIIQCALCLALLFQSCREDSEMTFPYANNNTLDFTEANESLESQFKAVWNAMNSNYPIWDYEVEHGLDWDKVYEKYIHLFRELDLEYDKHNPVPDSVVFNLYQDMFTPLHDGHLTMSLKNIHTGKRIWRPITPSLLRLADENRDSLELEYLDDFEPSLKYYIEQGNIEEWDQEDNYIYGKFKDGIVYYRLPDFNLTYAFKNRDVLSTYERIHAIWEKWFNTIQELHQKDSLKGVIIDLRNNDGGTSSDFQYVLGALFEGNVTIDGMQFHQIGYLRKKAGYARLDYSSVRPFYLNTYADKHANIEVPIVVLANKSTASTSEITCIAAKQLKYGYVIGTKTHGGFSPSFGEDDQISFTGNAGSPVLSDEVDKSIAPFYIKIPDAAFLTMDKKIIEGKGIEPDETVQLDWRSHQATGKDNQLEKALDYISTKQ